MMTKEETPEESHNYGAFFTSQLSMPSELPSEWSGPERNLRISNRELR